MNKTPVKNKDENKSKYRIILVYVVLVLISIIAFASVNVFYVSVNINREKDAFLEQSTEVYQHLLQVTQSTSFILDNFSVLLSGIGLTSYGTLVEYSQRVLERVPYIYQIQAAQKVLKSNLATFNEEQAMYGDFSVKVFDGRQLIKAEQSDANVFYPITFFVDKDNSDFINRGVDILSLPFLTKPTQLASLHQQTVFSEPFDYFDDARVFVMVQPAFFTNDTTPDYYVFFVIKSNSLLKNKKQLAKYHISIRATEHEEFLVQQSNNDGASIFLPQFFYQKELNIGAQNLLLTMKYQMPWSTVNFAVLAVIWAASILVVTSFIIMFKMHFKSELKRIKQSNKLFEMANVDSLTRLANRRYFTEYLEHSVKVSTRQNNALVVLYLDLDGFKAINDTFGHKVGDETLRIVAKKIKALLREVDVIGRLGGDEFAIILDNGDSYIDERIVIERVKHGVRDIKRVAGYDVDLGASIGVARFPQDATKTDDLLTIADQRMYQDKRQVKAPVVARSVVSI